MSWNYRFVEQEDKTLVLAEVYFNSKLEPYGWCNASVVLDDINDADTVFEMMKTAVFRPIVKLGDFVEDME